jgi:hypothetical protein
MIQTIFEVILSIALFLFLIVAIVRSYRIDDTVESIEVIDAEEVPAKKKKRTYKKRTPKSE